MSERLTLFMARECEHCDWVEAFLKKEKVARLKIFDCKSMIGKPGLFSCVERDSGTRLRFLIPGFPLLIVERDPPLAIVGAEGILQHFGGPKIMVVGS